jgi:RecQ helicase-like protein
MALPERRVRVILSVLEAMGVAQEVKAARWQGVEPRPTREQIDKAAMVFEARRISDRRRLAALLSYMNTQRCRVQMLRAYFGEPEGDKCGLCDSDAGLDSEVFDPGEDDARHGLHAATDFHARPRRRRRGRPGQEAPGMPAAPPVAAAPPAPLFETAIPTDVLPPLPEFEVPPPPDGADAFDEAIWMDAGAITTEPLVGEVVIDPADDWAAPLAIEATAEVALDGAPPSLEGVLPPDADDVEARWTAARDANIRPYLHWRQAPPVTLPVLVVRPSANNQPQHRPPHQHQQQHAGHHGQPRGGRPGFNGKGPYNGGGGGGGAGGGGGRGRRRGRDRDRDQRRGGEGFNRNRDRGPRLPGFYNPGGD